MRGACQAVGASTSTTTMVTNRSPILSFAAGQVCVVHDISPAGPPFTGTWRLAGHGSFRATVLTGLPGDGPGTAGPVIELKLFGAARHVQLSGSFTFTVTYQRATRWTRAPAPLTVSASTPEPQPVALRTPTNWARALQDPGAIEVTRGGKTRSQNRAQIVP